MIYFCLGLAAFAVLACILTARSGTGPVSDDPPAPPPPRPRQSGSRTRFIDAHLHRDDAKKARHKQNQFPL